MSKERTSRTFVGGVLILGAGNLLVKVIGLIFKIPLSRLLGDEGMGYFNTGYTVYSWLFLIGCTGFPIAVSMLVSEATEREGNGSGSRRILSVSLQFLFALGLAGCLLLSLFADAIAARIGNPGSADAISAIAPAVLFCSLSGGVRGYFQGKKRMGPTAISQLIEAALKLVLGILFARRAFSLGYGLPAVAAASIRGVTLGTVASTLFLFFELLIEPKERLLKYKGRKRGSSAALSRRLLSIAFPVTFSATVMSVTGLIDLIFVMKRLTYAGYATSEATAAFGNYTTLAVPFFSLPGILISPIATGLVPFVSSDLARSDAEAAKRRSSSAIRSALVLSVPAAFGLGLFGRRILSLFFLPASAAAAAPALAVLAPGVVFLSLVTVSGAILQARGRAWVNVLSMLIGAVVKTVAGYYLIGLPRFGVLGASIGTVLCYGVAATVNLVCLHVVFRQPTESGAFIRPLLPTSLSFALGYLTHSIVPERSGAAATCVLLLTSFALYFPLCLLLRTIAPNDVASIPLVRRFALHPRSKKDQKEI